MDKSFQNKSIYYNSYFRSAKSYHLKGEFYEKYLESGKEVIGRMMTHNPRIKIIVCLRNPIERAWSQYLNRVYVTKMKYSSFEEAIEKDFRVIIGRGFYYKKLNEYYKCFPQKNILALIKEDININSIEFIKRIYDFLNVDTFFVPGIIDRKISPTKFKITKLGKIIYKITPYLKRNKFGYRLQKSKNLKSWFYIFADYYSNKKNMNLKMSRDTQLYLKKIYKDDIQNLEKLIKRDLSQWK